MSTGGIFTIITNDGKQDRILMASSLLADRMANINAAKINANRMQYGNIPPDDVRNMPTLLDIEKTHVLFTNAHFKPFAAIGFEYATSNPTTGSPQLGSTITFSIPQFGDFFHDMALHVILQQPTLTSTATRAADAPAMRWCNYPGERLLKKVQQDVNGNPLDEYSSLSTVLHREYRVAPNKIAAWRRCVGQETPEEGYIRQNDWAQNLASGPGSVRLQASATAGNQTPTAQKTNQLEMFIPLLFWYNKDIRLAIPSVAIPFGQRFINIELANPGELCDMVPRGLSTWANPQGTIGSPVISKIELFINNIFMNQEVHKIYIKRVGFSLIRVHRQQALTINKSSDHILLSSLKWPCEYLFVGAKIRDYANSTSPALMRQNLDCWDQYSWYNVNQYFTDGYKVNQESALVASPGVSDTLSVSAVGVLSGSGVVACAGKYTPLYPANNTNFVLGSAGAEACGPGAAQTAAGLPAKQAIEIAGQVFHLQTAVAAGATLAAVVVTPFPGAVVTGLASEAKVLQNNGLEVDTKSWTPTLESIAVSAHSINIYKEYASAFFNSYLTYHYGGANLNAPKDTGSLFVPFCLYPGTYQPSGHINISRAREFYLDYTGSVFETVTGYLVVIASAINFLLITDGSAVLRYST
jgi:hypothetical protein